MLEKVKTHWFTLIHTHNIIVSFVFYVEKDDHEDPLSVQISCNQNDTCAINTIMF